MNAPIKPRNSLVLALAALLLLVVACNNSGIDSHFYDPAPGDGAPVADPKVTPKPQAISRTTITQDESLLVSEIPPCTPIEGAALPPCDPNASIFANLEAAGGHWIELESQPVTIREVLDGNIGFVPHIVVRGTIIPDTARCTSGNSNRTPTYREPGLVYHSSVLQCYVDVRANAYVLGSGPSQLTVLWSYTHYWDNQYKEIAKEQGQTLAEFLEFARSSMTLLLEGDDNLELPGIYGLELVLFLGPSHNQAVEVWERMNVWDVQRPDEDNSNSVQVVHPDRDIWREYRPEDYATHLSFLEVSLETFTSRVRAAHSARMTENGGRIGPANIRGRAEGVELPMLVSNVNQLDEFYTATGSYSHSDGPPVQPPPSCGSSIPDGSSNITLMADCIALLAAKDALRGTAALNWSTSVAIASWDGIATGAWNYPDQPIPFTRITQIKLPDNSLVGVIPGDLGDVLALTELDLSNNSLTGEIPVELGQLKDLAVLRLSGNALTGCIPSVLRDVPHQ